MTHIHDEFFYEFCPLSGFHVDSEIKLRDSTGQVKVHKINRKKRAMKRTKMRETSALSPWTKNPMFPVPRPCSLPPPPPQNSHVVVAHPCWWGPLGPAGHTVREMKLLYLWMFLLRISEQGPSTRSKRGRSSFTHLSGPRATTVAALGRFSSRAISPAGRRGREKRGQGFSWGVTRCSLYVRLRLTEGKIF